MIEASLPSLHLHWAITLSVSSGRSIRLVSVMMTGNLSKLTNRFYVLFFDILPSIFGRSASRNSDFCSANFYFISFSLLSDAWGHWFLRWRVLSVTHFGKRHGGCTHALLKLPQASWYLLGWLLVLLLCLVPRLSCFSGLSCSAPGQSFRKLQKFPKCASWTLRSFSSGDNNLPEGLLEFIA